MELALCVGREHVRWWTRDGGISGDDKGVWVVATTFSLHTPPPCHCRPRMPARLLHCSVPPSVRNATCRKKQRKVTQHGNQTSLQLSVCSARQAAQKQKPCTKSGCVASSRSSSAYTLLQGHRPPHHDAVIGIPQPPAPTTFFAALHEASWLRAAQGPRLVQTPKNQHSTTCARADTPAQRRNPSSPCACAGTPARRDGPIHDTSARCDGPAQHATSAGTRHREECSREGDG